MTYTLGSGRGWSGSTPGGRYTYSGRRAGSPSGLPASSSDSTTSRSSVPCIGRSHGAPAGPSTSVRVIAPNASLRFRPMRAHPLHAACLAVALVCGCGGGDDGEEPRAARAQLPVVRELPVEVPDLEDAEIAEAQERVADAGLQLEVHESGGLFDDLFGGELAVCEQDPEAGGEGGGGGGGGGAG